MLVVDKLKCFWICLLVLSGMVVNAQPDMARFREIGGDRVYFDARDSLKAYYLPGRLSLLTNRDGKPDFAFLRAGYVGTSLRDDRNQSRVTSILRFGVKMERKEFGELRIIEKQLWQGGKKGRLLPFPISKIEAQIVFVGAGNDTLSMGRGQLAANSSSGLSKNGTYWKEREFAFRLDNFSAETLWKTLKTSGSQLSVAYCYWAEVWDRRKRQSELQGPGSLVQQFSAFENSTDSLELTSECILADAFSVYIDVEKWPDLLRKVDINEQVPPAFAALEVRCYDFQVSQPVLLAKRIELKAMGIGGKEVKMSLTFNAGNPDLVAYNVRFPYAVRIDQPLYYRIISVPADGSVESTSWMMKEEWVGVLDVTAGRN